MNDDALSVLRDLLSLPEEERARALLELTLQAAPPDVADAVRVCALPAWFDADLLALLLGKDVEARPLRRLWTTIRRVFGLKTAKRTPEIAVLIEQIAAFSFILPREDGGYVYHEATRARLLDWWREPERGQRFAALNDRLARPYLALAREQDRRLSGPDYLDALAVLDDAYPNLQAAWEGVVTSENWELVQDFAYTLADYFRHRGLWAEWIAWRKAGLDACERTGDTESYAGLQNNLGIAYWSLPTGDRAANLEQAIACYREALRFWTPEAAPLDYAMTQNNLGTAYADLPTGDRAANLEQAMACYREALRFYTPEAAPFDYAMTQNNLGTAYADLPTGDRAANLEQAIQCYTAALQAEYLSPSNQAMYHRNRAEALIRLGRLDEAARDCEQARALAPDHPYTYARLGQLAFAHDDYPAAVEHYSAAIDRQPQADFYFGRGLAHLAWGHPDQALADYQAAIPLADSITIAEALKELNELAATHPDTPGLDAVRALFPSPVG